MNILFVGAFTNKWSTNYEMVDALNKLNHNVKIFNYRKYENKKKIFDKIFSFLKLFTWLPFKINKIYYEIYARSSIQKELKKEYNELKPDLVILAKTNTLNPSVINIFKKYSKVIYYFMDPPSTASKIRCDRYIAKSDISFVTFSSVRDKYYKYRHKIFVLPQGVDIKTFRKINLDKKYDVIFIGSKDKKREEYISFLKKNKISVECFGNGWKNKSIYKEDLNKVLNQSNIILNFSRDNVGFSIRVQQVMATGNLLISETCKDINSYFDDGKDIVLFKSKIELFNKILFFLKPQNRDLKEKIEKKGINKIKNDFMWEIIMKKIILNSYDN